VTEVRWPGKVLQNSRIAELHDPFWSGFWEQLIGSFVMH